CKIQGSIHVFKVIAYSMCPGFWVHIRMLFPQPFLFSKRAIIEGLNFYLTIICLFYLKIFKKLQISAGKMDIIEKS
ncbi:hypothetical protein, partial [Anaerovibrio sp.]|uniref:hypothetical protein n=1 Tax=Anaerovibrio sp. TaxID=1872532 RepID=UPI0025C17F01